MVKKIISGPIALLASLILSIILLPVGFLYTIGKYAKECKVNPILTMLKNFGLSILLVISYLCMRVAVAIDRLGNVVAGEFLEDFITSKENTLFSDPNTTISSSTGALEVEGELNETGIWFSNLLSRAIGEDNHAILSYAHQLESDKLNDRIENLTREELIELVKNLKTEK
nr:MAG TPA: hypothetical protein [Bacteriophage sp.]